MSNEIVIRLQNGLFYEVWDDEGIHWKSDITNKDIWEAIQEIERLQAEVAAWKNVAQEITMYAAMQELKEAAGE